MYSERMQLLLTPEQRRRVDTEAKRRGSSAAAVIREAIDAQIQPFSREERRAALERLEAIRIPFVPIDQLNAMIDEGRDVVPPM